MDRDDPVSEDWFGCHMAAPWRVEDEPWKRLANHTVRFITYSDYKHLSLNVKPPSDILYVTTSGRGNV